MATVWPQKGLYQGFLAGTSSEQCHPPKTSVPQLSVCLTTTTLRGSVNCSNSTFWFYSAQFLNAHQPYKPYNITTALFHQIVWICFRFYFVNFNQSTYFLKKMRWKCCPLQQKPVGGWVMVMAVGDGDGDGDGGCCGWVGVSVCSAGRGSPVISTLGPLGKPPFIGNPLIYTAAARPTIHRFAVKPA